MSEKESQKIASKQEYKNPFPGLRPFSSGEKSLFFGREEDTSVVVRKLLSNRFVVVTGSSGAGKSSLVSCGVVPRVAGKANWKIIRSTIGDAPLENLINDVLNVTVFKSPEEKNTTDIRLKANRIIDYLRDDYKQDKTNYLLVLDQFEQLFLYKGVDKKDSAYDVQLAYTSVITEIVKQTDIPVYVVLTMRSDFIGDCARFNEFARLVNESVYLLPQLNKDHLKGVIAGPLEYAEVDWDKRLADRILDDLAGNPDQLPILQHTLMRTFNFWRESDVSHRPLSVISYEEVGTVSDALSIHADEAYHSLDDESKKLCERIFKSVTRKGPDHKGVSRPTKVRELAEIAQVDEDKIIGVINTFNRKDRSFFSHTGKAALSSDTLIYPSHEALIRNWDRLRKWVDEEAASIHMYNRLAEAAAQFQMGKSNLWRPPDLQLAINWKETNRPNLAWGRQHDPAYERTMVFLELSENEYFQEQENKTRGQRVRFQRTQILSVVAAAATIVFLVFMIRANRNLSNLEERYYALENERKLIEQARTEAEEQLAMAIDDGNGAGNQSGSSSENNQLNSQQAQRQAERIEQLESNLAALSSQDLSNSNTRRAQSIEDTEQDERNQETAEEIEDISETVIEQPVVEIPSSQAEPEPASEVRLETSETTSAATKAQINKVLRPMISRSLQISEDPDLKALLAYQAYLFNDKYNNQSFDQEIYTALYDATKMQLGDSYNVYSGHSNAIRTIDFLPNTSSFFSSGSDGKILKWNINSENKDYATILSGRNVIEELKVTQNGRWLILAENRNGILLLNLASPSSSPSAIPGSDSNVRTIAVSSDNNTFYTAGLNNFVERYNITTRSSEKIINTDSRVNSLSLSPNGEILAGGTRNGKTIIWRMTGNFPGNVIFNDAENAIQCVKFSPNGRYLAGGTIDGDILIFRADNFEIVTVLSGHTARVTEIDFSRDGRYMASSGYDGKVLHWNMNNFADAPIVMEDNGGFVFAVNFSSDGRHVASGSSQEDRLLVRPATAEGLASRMCFVVSRNLTSSEWNRYVGEEIPYQKTCSDK